MLWSRKPAPVHDRSRAVGIDLTASRVRADGAGAKGRPLVLDEPDAELALFISGERRAPDIGRAGVAVCRRFWRRYMADLPTRTPPASGVMFVKAEVRDGGVAGKGLFAAEYLSDDQRRMLLSGRSSEGLAAAGPIVCACFGVGRATICDTIAAGAQTAAEIGAQLKAGTNCGSCIPELKRLIAQTPVNSPKQPLAAAN